MNDKEKGVQNLSRDNATADVVEIDLLELFYYFMSKAGYIIAGLVIGVVVAGIVTYFFITPLYTAQSKLYMVSSSKDSVVDISDLNIGTSLSSDYEQLITTRPVLDAVSEKLELPYSYEEMLDMLDVSTISNTRILVLKVTSIDPEEARDIANAIADEAVNRLPAVMDTPEPHIAEAAIIPDHRSSPSYTKNMLICGLVGMILVLGVLTLIFVMNDTLDSSDDVEKAFGITPLTVVPESDIGVLSEENEKKQKKHRRKSSKKTGDAKKTS